MTTWHDLGSSLTAALAQMDAGVEFVIWWDQDPFAFVQGSVSLGGDVLTVDVPDNQMLGLRLRSQLPAAVTDALAGAGFASRPGELARRILRLPARWADYEQIAHASVLVLRDGFGCPDPSALVFAARREGRVRQRPDGSIQERWADEDAHQLKLPLRQADFPPPGSA